MTGILKAAFDPVFAWPNTYIIWNDPPASTHHTTPTPSRGSRASAVVIDPGRGSRDWIEHDLHQHGLDLAAVLLTHGHMDHTWEAQPLADTHHAPVYLAEAGWAFLEHPEDAIPPTFPAHHLRGHPRRAPRDLRATTNPIDLPGITLTPIPTPGHSICSTTWTITTNGAAYLATGDTLLAHHPGEPIAPTGNNHQLTQSLHEIRALRAAQPGILLLPGHG